LICVGEKESAKKRVSELEKLLNESQEREQARSDQEKTHVDRLLALASVLGRKCFSLMLTLTVDARRV